MNKLKSRLKSKNYVTESKKVLRMSFVSVKCILKQNMYIR